MKCLVTGSTGYIGSNLTKHLISEGHQVLGLIHKKKPILKQGKNLTYIHADITDSNSLDEALSKIDIDVVFHCAAYVKDYGKKRDFYQINYEGTINLVSKTRELGISRFIYIGHIPVGSNSDYYSKTKQLAEQYLITQHKENKFPVVIIRPGNVFGPGRNLWVVRVFKAIIRNRITLIDNGKGIFHHTYIDNLLDALVSSVNKSDAIGEIFEITDGDNTITWGEYLNFLSHLAQNKNISRSISKNSAYLLSRLSMILYRIFKIKPVVTPLTVDIFTNKEIISIEKAGRILKYSPKVDYNKAINNIEHWLKSEGDIE